ncbi:hypothetical protein [Trinickia sp. EG282A]|uniref:hypothetical protein n=1 Tax=Trinickia sp. EG282A TaxID=3237013 RepID=UPI0034D1EBA0
MAAVRYSSGFRRSILRAPRLAAYVRHLCSLGLESTTVVPSILGAVREIVGADYCNFIWASDDFELASVYSECEAAYKTLPAYQRLQRSGDVSKLIGNFPDWMTVPLFGGNVRDSVSEIRSCVHANGVNAT